MSTQYNDLIGLSTGWRTMAYTWRDAVLYALAVGAGWEEPQYTYEKDLQRTYPHLRGYPLLEHPQRQPQAPAPLVHPRHPHGQAPTGAALCELRL